MKNFNVEKISNMFVEKLKKLKNWQIVLIFIIGLGFVGAIFWGNDEELLRKENQKTSKEISNDSELKENNVPTCDGINIMEDCQLNGKKYTVYKYYPAVKEKSHTETVTKYKEGITGHCTLCNDGTYSPTCATGRGACSHHGGVAQWNAPIYGQVAYYEEIKVIDTPATAEKYDIVEKK